MAQKVVLLDDISGEENAETVVFGWDGDWYEIDVADKNRQALEKALEKYIEHARPASKKPKSSASWLRRRRGRARSPE